MDEVITYEEIKLWRSSTEKITLEEFAQKLGKTLCKVKESHDICDVVNTPESTPLVEIIPEISFKKELTDREKVVFDYLRAHQGKVVYVKELAKVLNLPNNDYVYKYIKNIREKLIDNILENAEKGGYVLH